MMCVEIAVFISTLPRVYYFELETSWYLQVYLPPLSAFPHVIDFSFNNVGREYRCQRWMGFKPSWDLKHMRDHFVKKVVLSSSPDGQDDWFAVAIMCYTGEMVYCDGKDGESWKLVDARLFSCVEGFFSCEDVIYDKGLFYGVDKRGWIAMLDLRNHGEGAVVQLKVVEIPESFGGDVVYLVKLKDDLLMVSRILDAQCELDGTMFHKTIRFEVYKLDWSLLRWDVVKELGDYALFLGQNSSLSLSASLYGGCRENCIYFTDDLSENTSNGDWRYHDMGVFNLKNRRIKPLVSYWENSECTPMWVTPNPCLGDPF
ncbi:putative F-box protein [Drosera capensis]